MRLQKMVAAGLCALVFGCSSVKNNTRTGALPQLKFLHEYIVPNNYHYQNTWVGGLSGIDYDADKNQYYFICDERSATSPARFYTAKINISNNKIDTLIFTGVETLKKPSGDVYPSLKLKPEQAADPESIRYHAKTKTLYWSDEGDKAVRNGKSVKQNPWVYQVNAKGEVLDSLLLPDNIKMYTKDYGARENEVLEGLSFSPDGKYLWASMEGPIYQDGPLASPTYANAPVRFTKFDVATRKPLAQYAYPLDAVAHRPNPTTAFNVNGVPELLAINDHQFLVLERSFSTGVPDCVIKIFLAEFAHATNVLDVESVYQNKEVRLASKKLLLNLASLGISIDNIEGITFGPTLPNGHRSLLLVSDNNFSDREKTQVILFEVK